MRSGAALVFAVYYTAYHNFRLLSDSKPYGPDNPFSYVHTSPDMLDLVDDIERVWAVKPGSKVLIAVAQHWPPLPYYLRAHRELTGYYTPSDLLDAASKQEVVVAETSVELDKTVGEKKYLRLSEVQETNVYFRRNKKE